MRPKYWATLVLISATAFLPRAWTQSGAAGASAPRSDHVAEVRKAQKAAYAISDATNGCPVIGTDMFGWPGNIIRHCVYKKGPQGHQLEAVVYLLDVKPEVIARWIESSCANQLPNVSSCFSTVLSCGKDNSGMMFPISGNMMENMENSPWKNYFFRNGMTVSIGGEQNGSTAQISLERQEAVALMPNSAVTSIPTGLTRFWRTRPAQFAKQFPTVAVPPSLNSPKARGEWLDIAHSEFLAALSNPNNRLLEAWVAAHPKTLSAGRCPGDNEP